MGWVFNNNKTLFFKKTTITQHTIHIQKRWNTGGVQRLLTVREDLFQCFGKH